MQNYIFISKPTRIYLRKLLQKSAKFAWELIRNTANYSQNLPICVCSSRKLEKNGKICKNHEEKHKIDVKENEKSGEMRGFATPKQGMRDQKQGIWALQKGQEAHISSTPKRSSSPQQHALKGQKLLAQGIALGIMPISNAPCKGKSFKIHLIIL